MSLASGVDIELKTELATDLPPVVGNEASLRTALTNLIFNAVDALDEGGTITLRTVHEDEDAVVEVADTGQGMSEEVRRRALEPFFTTKGDSGTGMGLAMVHGIVQRHGGSLNIDSEPAKGTTISVRLPLKMTERKPAVASEERQVPTGLRVLVVDDDQVVREMLIEFLERDGQTVVSATDGRDALEQFRRAEFDLVITDRGMPGMGGDELAVSIKEAAPETPVIMVTGFGELMASAGERPEGVDLFLSKPVTPSALRKAIAEVWSDEDRSPA